MSLQEMLLVVCPLVFFASFVDAIAGGGGLIALPAYLLTGIPAHMAIGTGKFSSTIGTVISTSRFIRSGNLHLAVALKTAVFACIGSALGARLALSISDYYLRLVMMILLPVAAIFILFNRRQLSDESRFEQYGTMRIVLGTMLTGLLIGIYDGFFGPGTGTFLIIAFTVVMGFDLRRACGNAKIVNLATNMSALAVFALAGQVYYQLAIPATIFSVLGGWLGSGMAIKNGAKFIRPVMFGVLCLLLLRIGWDMFAAL